MVRMWGSLIGRWYYNSLLLRACNYSWAIK